MSTSSSDDNALDEWKEARAVLARFDANVHDLRKYGFSFVTALLAANGLISVSLSGSTSEVPPLVRAGILVVTMGLIVTLKLLDTHYRCFQNAAATRGKILEDRLNLDLTSSISLLYNLENWWRYVQYLYYGFIALTALLGLAILWGEWILFLLVVIAGVITGLFVFFINYKRAENLNLWDWSVDRKIVSKGTPVRITFTNLSQSRGVEPYEFQLSWVIKEESTITDFSIDGLTKLLDTEKSTIKTNARLAYFENYDWLWKTDDKEAGLYEIVTCAKKIFTKEGERVIQSIDKGSRFSIQIIQAPKEQDKSLLNLGLQLHTRAKD